MLHLALAQAPGGLDRPSERLDWLRGILPDLQAQNADLLVLPELFACGYNIGEALTERAEPADGATAQAIAQLARAFGVAIHYGFAEQGNGVLYNSAQCIAADGQILSLQRKLAIPPGFERDHFVPGTGCHLFDYAGLRIATLICYDAEFPESLRYVAMGGAQLVLVPTALGQQWGWVARTIMPARAYENGVFLAYANSAGTQGDMTFLGESVIAAPDGAELARAGSEPELLFARLDPARVAAAQTRLPYLKDRTSIRF